MPRDVQAVVFDLDGVLVRSDEYHYRSWAALAAELGTPFTREDFDRRLRGLERSEAAREFIGQRPLPVGFDLSRMAARKQELFLELVAATPLEPAAGAAALVDELDRDGYKLAVGSSSRNARWILQATGLAPRFQAVVDGNEAPGKPRPDIFLLAARRLNVEPAACVVVEDALDGIEAARRAGMRVVAIGTNPLLPADVPRVESLAELADGGLKRLAGR